MYRYYENISGTSSGEFEKKEQTKKMSDLLKKVKETKDLKEKDKLADEIVKLTKEMRDE